MTPSARISTVSKTRRQSGRGSYRQAAFLIHKERRQTGYFEPGARYRAVLGENVTLYYGVGADKVQDATVGQSTCRFSMLQNSMDAVTGTYCKSTVNDATKDCITLAQDDNGSVYRVTAKDTGISSEGILIICSPCVSLRGRQCRRHRHLLVRRLAIAGRGGRHGEAPDRQEVGRFRFR